MSVSIGQLVGYLQLQDNLSPALKVAQANVATAAKSLDKLGDSLSKAGHAMLPISAAITVAGGAVFKYGKDFETTLTQIRTLVGESADQVDNYKNAVLSMSKEVAKSPQELAEALYFITSSGVKGAEALETLNVSAKASALGLGETKVVADAATSALNAYGAENITTSEAVRVLVATVREGKGEADQLAGAIGRVIPIAAEMGVRFQDLGAFMAATTKIGLSAEESATALRAALVTMSQPTQEQTDAFAKLSEKGLLPLGFGLEDVRKTIKEKGLAQGFMQLTEATRGNSEALTAIVGNVRAATGVLGAYGKQGEETLRIQAKMRTDLHEVDEGFKLVTKTIDFQWNQALSNLQAVAIHAFDAIKPSFAGMLNGIQEGTKALDGLVFAFQKLPAPVQTTIVAFAGLTALAAPALIAIGATFKGLSIALDGLKLGLGWLATNAAAVEAGILGIGTAALAAAAGFAGWKIGEKIREIELFGGLTIGDTFDVWAVKAFNWARGIEAADKDIINAVQSHRNLAEVVEQAGTAFTDAEIAALSYQSCVVDLATPTEVAKNLTQQFNDEMLHLTESVVALTPAQREAIQTGLKLEKATADIAIGLGVTDAAVKAYAAGLAEADRAVEEFAQKQRKSMDETKDLWSENAALVAEATMTSQGARLAAIEATFQKEVAAIEGVGEVYDAHYAALRANANATAAMIGSAWASLADKSLEAAKEQAAAARADYERMIASGLTFNKGVLEEQLAKVRELEARARGYSSGWKAVGEDGAAAAKKIVTGFDHLTESVEQTLQRVKGVKKAMEEVYSFDIKDLTKTQKAAINAQNSVGSMLSSDPNVGLKNKLAELENREGTYAPKSAAEYTQMISDQVLLQQLRRLDLSSASATAATSPASVVARATPSAMPSGSTSSASSGGVGMSVGGIGAPITNNFYVNGTGDQVAKVVSDQLMTTLKVGRQFGAA